MTKQQLFETIRRVIKEEVTSSLTDAEKKELEDIEDQLRHDVKTDSAISPSLYKRYKELKAKLTSEGLSEKKYPVAGEDGNVRVSQLKKGDILGATGLEVVSVSAGAMTPSGKVEVTVKNPKTGKEVTKLWGKSTVVKLKDKTEEAAAPAPSKPKTSPGVKEPPAKSPGKPKPRRPLGNPEVKPGPKAEGLNEEEMLKKIVKRFRSAKNG
jgi:hypothetical protein